MSGYVVSSQPRQFDVRILNVQSDPRYTPEQRQAMHDGAMSAISGLLQNNKDMVFVLGSVCANVTTAMNQEIVDSFCRSAQIYKSNCTPALTEDEQKAILATAVQKLTRSRN